MGMFDWYKPIPELACPKCGQILQDWQGKDGPCGLFVWEQGAFSPVAQPIDDDAQLPKDHLISFRLPQKFRIYTDCTCGIRVLADGECDEEIWMHTNAYIGTS